MPREIKTTGLPAVFWIYLAAAGQHHEFPKPMMRHRTIPPLLGPRCESTIPSRRCTSYLGEAGARLMGTRSQLYSNSTRFLWRPLPMPRASEANMASAEWQHARIEYRMVSHRTEKNSKRGMRPQTKQAKATSLGASFLPVARISASTPERRPRAMRTAM